MAKPPTTFQPLPEELDFPAMERRILQFWDENRCFERLREKNAAGPKWSFLDGPITANNPMGVHHGWGRTYKDIYQRYRAMRGYHQRFQNGFDCQGLWLEVEVEKDLGFNSKRDIESFGLAEFADACRARVDKYSQVQIEQSIRLGQWMDWPDSYYTHTDSNIEHIWHFLKTCHQRGWITKAQRAMPWCPRCGTALSQHELIDTYQEIEHQAVTLRLSLVDQPGAALLVWTTTPWTLVANVAAAVHPELEYMEVEQDGERLYLASSMAEAKESAVVGEYNEIRRIPGSELVGWSYTGPFDELPAVKGIAHRVIAWDEVAADEGTGIVHIAPGAGEEDFRLGEQEGLPVLVPIDENGHYVEGHGPLDGRDARTVAEDVVSNLLKKGLLYHVTRYSHRYPHCWRCHEELVFRVDDEWFIRADPIRPELLEAAATVRWIPEYAGTQMTDWLQNMGDWNISRRRYWGLPLPFYPCKRCGHLTVIGSRTELAERAVDSLDGLRELHRPWVDDVRIACEACGAPSTRIDAVGDAWLDAGIVPFSTLRYLDQDAAWADWYPVDFITEMREQIRLWFYSMLFMSVTLEGRAPYRAAFVFEKLNDEAGQPMHKSLGNAVNFNDAADRMGADVMRWLYAGQNPLANINFGYGPAGEVKRRMLTLWNLYAFFVTYARLDGFDPSKPPVPLAERADLDRWVLSRLQSLVDVMTDAMDQFLVHRGVRATQEFVEDVSNWYVRRGRRRYWKAEDDTDKRAAYQTLYEVLTTLVQLLAPVMPFWTEDIYQNLVRAVDPEATTSVHLTDWPEVQEDRRDPELDAAMADVQRVVRAGRAARNAANVKLRQPLRTAVVVAPEARTRIAVDAHIDHVLEELNVKAIEWADSPDFVSYEVRPDFRILGPRLGRQVKAVARALGRMSSAAIVQKLEAQESVKVQMDGDVVALEGADLDIRTIAQEGYGVGEHDGVIAAVTTEIDDELRTEALAREVIHAVQNRRRDAGLDVADRIHLWLDGDDQVGTVIASHGDEVAREVLATELTLGSSPHGGETVMQLNGVGVIISLAKVDG